MQDRHELYVYRSTWFYPGEYVADCECHGFSEHSRFFFDAVGRAFLHRAAVVR